MSFIRRIYHSLFPVKIKGRNNIIKWKQKCSNVRIDINGNNNEVIIKKAATLSNLHIVMRGDNNKLIIGSNCRIYGPCHILIENGAEVNIGKDTGLRGVKILANTAPITIGSNCMTSYNVLLRNHDSHTIFSSITGEIINRPRAISIGDHVWLAENVTVLKGAKIGNNSVIGFGSIVTREIPNNSIAAGAPANLIKGNIEWEK